MHVDERLVMEAQPTDASWFAARQPAIIRYLARHCDGDDPMSVGLHAACSVHAAYELAIGVPPARVQSSLLDRAERAIVAEADRAATDGVVLRQPALAEFVASVVACPPLPLDAGEASRLGLALLAIVYALDEMTTGRPVP